MILRYKRWLRALGYVVAIGGAGCDAGGADVPTPAAVSEGETPTPTPVDPLPVTPEEPVVSAPDAAEVAAAVAAVDANLAALRALSLFEVGELVVDSPWAGGNCYGFPCDDAERQAVRERNAVALAQLTAQASAIAEAPREPTSACALGGVDGHLATLDALHVVEVGAFLMAEPANDPNCYNLPCPQDIEDAQIATCDRAAQLALLAQAAAEAFGVPLVDTATPTSREQAALDALDANLARLAQLALFEVGALVADAPVEHESCYVCPPLVEIQSAGEAAVRLAALADHLEAVAARHAEVDPETLADAPACAPDAVDATLAALDALQIVGVGRLVDRDAAQAGLCYVGFCSAADEALADAMTCKRAVVLDVAVREAPSAVRDQPSRDE